jgi:hypothetical protein
MPVIQDQLDAQGHSHVKLFLYPSLPRIRALQTVGQPQVQPLLADGIIDPGASVTIIDPRIRQALNLTPFRIRPIMIPSQAASVLTLCYKLDLIVLHPSGTIASSLIIQMLAVYETPLSHTGTDVLIGCDVLSRCAFIHNGPRNMFLLSY